MHLDVQLPLGRYLVETATTGITLNYRNAQTVAGILAYALETAQQSRLNLGLQVASLGLQFLLLVPCLLHDFLQFATLFCQRLVSVFYQFTGMGQFPVLLVYLDDSFLNFLVTQLHFQCLKLYLLAQRVVFAVVLHLIQLLLIALDAGLSLYNLALFPCHRALEIPDFTLYFFHARVQSLQFVCQVLYFEGQLSSQRTFLVNRRECKLQLIECLQFLFYR